MAFAQATAQTPGRGGRARGALLSGAKTAGSVAVTVFGLLALTFFIGRLLPLDPVLAILGDDASQEAYDRLYVQLGLDRPLVVQFATYVRDALTLDFGRSLTSGRPVIEDIARVFPATLELATVAMALGTAIGVPPGVIAAARKGTWVDQTARVVLAHVAPMCIPSVIVRVTLNMAGIILTAAGLGFLGLGAQPPSPEWGAMLSTGRGFMLTSWWMAAMPGAAILLVSLAFNLLGDGLRDALDPRAS